MRATLLGLIVVAALGLSFWRWWTTPAPLPLLPPPDAAALGGGTFSHVDGWPRLTLAGTPYQMGAQQGTLLRPYLRDLVATRLEPALASRNLTLADGERLARHMLPRLPAPLREELEGVAAGARLPLETVLLWNLRDEAMALGPELPAMLGAEPAPWLPQRPAAALVAERAPWPTPLPALWQPPAAHEQSALVAAWGTATPDGQPLLAALLDAPPGGEALLLVERRPDSGPQVVGLALPGEVGLRAGWNEHGLWLLHVPFATTDRLLEGLPPALLARWLLGESSNQDEARQLLADAQRSSGATFLMADRSSAHPARLDVSARQLRTRLEGEAATTLLALAAPSSGPMAAAAAPLRGDEGARRARMAAWLRANSAFVTQVGLQGLAAESAVSQPRTGTLLLLRPSEGTLWLAQAAQGQPAPASGWLPWRAGD